VVAGHVLDDRQAQARPAGAGCPRLVHPVEALEHSVTVLAWNADPTVGDGDLGEPRAGAGGHGDPGRPGAVGHRIGQQVRHGGRQLPLDPAHHEPVLPADGDLDLLGARRRTGAVHGLGDHRVDVHGLEFRQRLAALEPGQVDQLTHEAAEPVGLVGDAAGEALHRLRIVGGTLDRLGEQRQRPDRRLQLVADVGHEVAADGIRPPGLGHVLQHQRHRTRRRGGATVQPDAMRPHEAGAAADQVAGEADVGPPAAPGPHRLRQSQQLGDEEAAAADDAQRPCGGIGQQHRVVGVDEHHGRVHEVQEPPGEGRLGKRDRRVAGRGAAVVVAGAEDDRGGHDRAQEEADHEGNHWTHDLMLGPTDAGTAPLGGMPRPDGSLFTSAWGGVHRSTWVCEPERPNLTGRRGTARGRGDEEDDRCGTATARNSTTSGHAWSAWRTRWVPR
jgi:hypothetical protein